MVHFSHIFLLLWMYIGQLPLIYAQDGRSHALGRCKTVLTDRWTVFNNPGALGAVKGFGGLLSYEQKFLLADLADISLAVILPTNNGNFGIGLVASGFSLLRKNELSIGYGIKLAENFSLGVRLSCLITKYADQSFTQKYFRAGLGLNYWITRKLVVSSFASNLGSFAQRRDQLPLYNARPGLFVGVNYQLSNKVLIVSEVSKTLLLPLNFIVGLEYEVMTDLFFRAGVYTQRLTNTFGVGYRIKQLTLDIGGEKHPILGYSLTSSLFIKLNNKIKEE